ncbi:MAG: hypothetical protein M3Q81_04830, partial [bacterium]|nr:hypothetical protein [bacterium]
MKKNSEVYSQPAEEFDPAITRRKFLHLVSATLAHGILPELRLSASSSEVVTPIPLEITAQRNGLQLVFSSSDAEAVTAVR